MKSKNNHLYLKIALILSSDINLNPGPVTRDKINDPKFEAFNSKGLHFIHLIISSILPKIDEFRNTAKYSNSPVTGITETKLDNTVYDSEVTIGGYSIVRNDRNRKGWGVAYISSNNIHLPKQRWKSFKNWENQTSYFPWEFFDSFSWEAKRSKVLSNIFLLFCYV